MFPDHTDALHENSFSVFRRLRPHQLCRACRQFFVACRNRRHTGTARTRQDCKAALCPVQRGHVIRQTGVQHAVGIHDNPGQYLFSNHHACQRAGYGGEHGVGEIFECDHAVGVAERFQRSDLLTLLLNHSRHRCKADKGGHEEEDDREKFSDIRNTACVLAEAFSGSHLIPSPDVPGRFFQIREGCLAVRNLLLRIRNFRFGVGFCFFVFSPAVFQFFFLVGDFLLCIRKGNFAVSDFLFRIRNLRFTVSDRLFCFG